MSLLLLAACGPESKSSEPPIPVGTLVPTVTHVALVYQASFEPGPFDVDTASLPTPAPTPTPQPVIAASAAPVYAIPIGDAVERWRPLVAEYFPPEAVDEGLDVISHESGGDPNIYNLEGSGACGLWQDLPCECIDPECNTRVALRKWHSAGDSFYGPWKSNWP